jgi:hypothetical protein
MTPRPKMSMLDWLFNQRRGRTTFRAYVYDNAVFISQMGVLVAYFRILGTLHFSPRV